MEIHIHHHHGSDQKADNWHRLFDLVHEILKRLETLMSIAPEVQKLLDSAKSNTTILGSIDTGMQALAALIADLKNQIANSQSLTDDEKADLTATAGGLDQAVTKLQADIPANTPAASGSGGAASGGVSQSPS